MNIDKRRLAHTTNILFNFIAHRHYKDEQHSPAEFKEEISYHYKMKWNLEMTLPASIIIGPFNIITEPLKQFLVNKRQEICTKLLEVLTAMMKGYIEEVMSTHKRDC